MYGAATGGGCGPGRGPADIGTPSELPTGSAPGICPAVSERHVLTRRGGRSRVGRTRPLAPDWVARDRREKSGRAGQGYPAARRDGRRPASLVTRRGGVHRRVAACGSKGSEPGHKRGHNAQCPANAGQNPRRATIGVVLPGGVLSVRSEPGASRRLRSALPPKRLKRT